MIDIFHLEILLKDKPCGFIYIYIYTHTHIHMYVEDQKGND